MPQPLAAPRFGDHHPANHHITALGHRIQQAQVGQQLVVLPGHQVAGIARQVLAVEVLVGTFLFHHENLVA